MQYKRLYISADIEGVAGVVSGEQTLPDGFEYQEAREWMTREVLAACEAAFEHGVESIVISDSHGNGQNLLPDRLPACTEIVRSWPRPLCMMEGIAQGNFDAAFLLGYHTGAKGVRGVLAHTLSGRGIRSVKLNGQEASETMISAATAGHFNVPVIMVSGDDAYTEHAQSLFSDVEVATVKWAASTTSARSMRPVDACALIRQSAAQAISRLDSFNAYQVELPVTVEVDLVQRKSAELLAYLPQFKRSGATGVVFEAADMLEVSKILSFLLAFNGL